MVVAVFIVHKNQGQKCEVKCVLMKFSQCAHIRYDFFFQKCLFQISLMRIIINIEINVGLNGFHHDRRRFP